MFQYHFPLSEVALTFSLALYRFFSALFRGSGQQIKNMEDLTAEIPSNEKSCQTDELDEKASVLRPEHLNQKPGKASLFFFFLLVRRTSVHSETRAVTVEL